MGQQNDILSQKSQQAERKSSSNHHSNSNVFKLQKYRRKAQKPTLNQNVSRVLSNRRRDNSLRIGGLQTYQIIHRNVNYQGQWQNNLPHGEGVIFFPDGSYYQGQFVRGEAQTSDGKKGLLINSRGDTYQGSFKNSQMHGYGSMMYNDKTIYQGNWEDGLPNGSGKQIFSDKDSYEGDFKNGKKHGKGIYVFNNGSKYFGQFKYDLMDGQGKIFSGSNGDYHGTFVRGKKSGKGKLKTAYGSLEGVFKDDYVEGPGVFKWTDGRVYSGDFKKSKFHGQGAITFTNGNILEGNWEEGHNLGIKSAVQSNIQQ